jgi:hypothetical protein
MTTRESRLTEAAPDTLTKGCTDSLSDEADLCRDLLARIEGILSNILDSFEWPPLAGAR